MFNCWFRVITWGFVLIVVKFLCGENVLVVKILVVNYLIGMSMSAWKLLQKVSTWNDLLPVKTIPGSAVVSIINFSSMIINFTFFPCKINR